MTVVTGPTLEERVARAAAAQRRQRERWAEEGRCDDCGSDRDVTLAMGYDDLPVNRCAGCSLKRAGAG